MRINEFKAWLDGYLAAGGSDVSVIKAQLDKTSDYAAPISPAIPPYNPSQPGTGRWPYAITCKTEAVA